MCHTKHLLAAQYLVKRRSKAIVRENCRASGVTPEARAAARAMQVIRRGVHPQSPTFFLLPPVLPDRDPTVYSVAKWPPWL